MANQLKVGMQQTILTLWQQGWSQRAIARTLGVHRKTVWRYISAAAGAGPKCTIPPPGSAALALPAAPVGGTADATPDPAKGTIPPAGSGRRSTCAAHADYVAAQLALGLSARRLYQDLVTERGFTGSYDAVKRFTARLRAATPLPFRRMECAPGEEAQVDFGRGAPIVLPDGRRRWPKVFRIVLSHSRQGYSEVVGQESTESFIRALENTFRQWGGVPRTLVTDNLRAAVSRPDWYDPELTAKVADFCRHYGTVILPTKPRTPRHKGKIEGGIKYVRFNALKGRNFPSLPAENAFLRDWEARVADTRIHGTTRRQVRQAFAAERPALLPLPDSLFPCFEEGPRTVHRDGHVEVAHAYYSVPPEYVRRELRVRWDLRTVRVFDQRGTPVAMHARVEAGHFSTQVSHLPTRKRNGLERGQEWQLAQAARLGDQARRWAEAMLQARGIAGTRVLQGLLALPRRHPAAAIEQACGRALELQAFRLQHLRQLLHQPLRQPELAFLDDHPVIRSLDHYGRLIPAPHDHPSERTPA